MSAATVHTEVLAGLAALEATLDAGTAPGKWRQEPNTAAGRVWVRIDHKGDLMPVFEVRSWRDQHGTERAKVFEQREADAALIVAAVNTLRASIDLARLVAHRHAPDGIGRQWCLACNGALSPCDQYRAAALVAGVDLTERASS